MDGVNNRPGRKKAGVRLGWGLTYQYRANIQIYLDIQIFVSAYWIFEHEYWKFDFLTIFIFYSVKKNVRPTLTKCSHVHLFVLH